MSYTSRTNTRKTVSRFVPFFVFAFLPLSFALAFPLGAGYRLDVGRHLVRRAAAAARRLVLGRLVLFVAGRIPLEERCNTKRRCQHPRLRQSPSSAVQVARKFPLLSRRGGGGIQMFFHDENFQTDDL